MHARHVVAILFAAGGVKERVRDSSGRFTAPAHELNGSERQLSEDPNSPTGKQRSSELDFNSA